MDGIFSGSHTFLEERPAVLCLKCFETGKPNFATDNVIEIRVGNAKTLAEALAIGEPAYEDICEACHRSDGTGINGLGAPLVANNMVLTNASEVIETILNGRGSMSDQSHLPDEDIAAIVTYISNSWGNDTGVVTQEDDVADAR